MGYPPGMDTAAGRALQEAADFQFGSYDWRAEYGRYGREPVSIEVAEEGIQEVVYNAKERERLVELEAASKYLDGKLAETMPIMTGRLEVVRDLKIAG